MSIVSLTDSGYNGVIQRESVDKTRYDSGVIKTGESLRLADVISLDGTTGEVIGISNSKFPIGVITNITYKHDFYRDNPTWTQDSIIPAGTNIEFVYLNSNAVVPLNVVGNEAIVLIKGDQLQVSIDTGQEGRVELYAGSSGNPNYIIGRTLESANLPSGSSKRILVRLS